MLKFMTKAVLTAIVAGGLTLSGAAQAESPIPLEPIGKTSPVQQQTPPPPPKVEVKPVQQKPMIPTPLPKPEPKPLPVKY